MQTEEFKEWLRARGVGKKSVNSRPAVLRRLEKVMLELGSPFQDLDEAYDADNFENLKSILLELRVDAKAGGKRYQILYPATEDPLTFALR